MAVVSGTRYPLASGDSKAAIVGHMPLNPCVLIELDGLKPVAKEYWLWQTKAQRRALERTRNIRRANAACQGSTRMVLRADGTFAFVGAASRATRYA